MAANLSEPSSSLSFTSSYISNGASAPPASPSTVAEPRSSLEIVSLSKLSSNLERLLVDKDFDCSDAEILVEGEAVPVHRCILSARSRFFFNLFAKGAAATADGGAAAAEGKPRYYMSDLVPQGNVRVEAFKTFLGYIYTGKLKPSPPEVSTCAHGECAHDACGPAINFAVELMYASSVFQIPELVSLLQVLSLTLITIDINFSGILLSSCRIWCSSSPSSSSSPLSFSCIPRNPDEVAKNGENQGSSSTLSSMMDRCSSMIISLIIL